MDSGRSINNTFIGKVVENKFYFSERRFNGLFCFDLSTYKCDFIAYFKNESVSAFDLHRACVFYKNKLFFMPWRSKAIHVYDINTNVQSCIDIEKETDNYIYDYVIENNFLYYFQMNSVSIIQINMDNNTVKKDADFSEWYNDMFGDKKYEIAARLSYSDGNVYIPTSNANLIMEWNIRNNKGKVYETDICGIFEIYKGKEGIWITDKDTYNIYLWNLNNKTIVYNGEEFIEDKNIPPYLDKMVYNHIVEFEEYTIFILRWLGYLLIRNNENDTFFTIKIQSGDNLKQNQQYDIYSMYGYDIDDKCLYIFSQKGLVTLDKRTLEVNLIPIILENPALVAMIKSGLLRETILQSEKSVFVNENYIPLDIYCRAICEVNLNDKEKNNLSIGNIVMKKLKDDLLI